MAQVALTVFSFLAFLLTVFPVPLYWRTRNIPVLCLLFWIASLNATHFVNSMLWANSVALKASIWCDISTKLLVGMAGGVNISSLCTILRVESVACGRSGVTSSKDRARRTLIELVLCIGLPIVLMALHYIVQEHRFDMYEDFGCAPSLFISWQAILVVFVPPLIVALLSLALGARSLHLFVHRRPRSEKLRTLMIPHSAVPASRYFRLLGLTFFAALYTTATCIVILRWALATPLRTYTSWADVHQNFGVIERFSGDVMGSIFTQNMVFTWWVEIIGTFVFFVFLGVDWEVVGEYKVVSKWVLRCASFGHGRRTQTSSRNALRRDSDTSFIQSADLEWQRCSIASPPPLVTHTKRVPTAVERTPRMSTSTAFSNRTSAGRSFIDF